MDKSNIAAIFAPTVEQKALLYHSLCGEGPDPGLIQVRFQVSGALDQGTFIKAWEQVIAQHDALRLSVQMPQGHDAMMVLAKAVTMPVRLLEITDQDPGGKATELARIVQHDASQPLDVSDPAVMRMTVIRFSTVDHAVLWTCHHMFLDGWSATLVLRHVMEAYGVLRGHDPKPQGRIPSYRDYRGWLKQQPIDFARDYWTGYFADAQNCAGRVEGLRSAQLSVASDGEIEIPDEVWNLVQTTSRALQVTPAAIVTAAWAVLLRRLCQSEDVVFGTSSAGRSFDMPKVEEMIGCFSTVLACRVTTSGSLRDIAMTLHEDGFETQPHAILPLDEVLHCARAGGVSGFDTLLVYENLPPQDLYVPVDGGLRIHDFASGVTSAFAITAIFVPGEQLRFKYMLDDSLDAEKAQSFLSTFPVLLKQLCGTPETPIAQLDVPLGQRITANTQAVTTNAETTPTLARTSTQLKLAQIWQSVLGREQIDIDTDFVDLGGRSFDAVRVLAQIEAQFGKRISLREFVRVPTIAHLADILNGAQSENPQWKSLVPIQPLGTKRPLMFLFVGGGHVIFLRPLAKRLGLDQPLFGFSPPGLEGEVEPLKSFEALASLYVKELLSVQPKGPFNLIGNCGGARLSLEVAHQLKQAGHDVERIIALDTYEPWSNRGMTEPRDLGGRMKVHLNKLTSGRVDLVAATALRVLYRNLKKRLVDSFGSEETKRRNVLAQVEKVCTVADLAYKGKRFDGPLWLLRSSDEMHKEFDWSPFAARVEKVSLRLKHIDMFFEPSVAELANAVSMIVDGQSASDVRSQLKKAAESS
jgi:thioesterase domain-containing protein/acyl carrier protein